MESLPLILGNLGVYIMIGVILGVLAATLWIITSAEEEEGLCFFVFLFVLLLWPVAIVVFVFLLFVAIAVDDQ